MKHLFDNYYIDEWGNFCINHKRDLVFKLRSKDRPFESIAELFKQEYTDKLLPLVPTEKIHPFWKFIK